MTTPTRKKELDKTIKEPEYDEFGCDRQALDKYAPIFDLIYKYYWRVETSGIENVPSNGGVLLVANHSGVIPIDAVMIKLAVYKQTPNKRNLRVLVEKFVYKIPFLNVFFSRTGQVLACPENTVWLLKKGEPVLVFPEGVKGIGKERSKRYVLQRFGRGGFVRMAIQAKVPIIPVAVVGAEEAYSIIYNLKYPAKWFGLPYLPITTTFPWLGPLGLIPMPSKWFIHFENPVRFDNFDPSAVDDDYLIQTIAEEIRQIIQNRIVEILKKRRSVFFG